MLQTTKTNSAWRYFYFYFLFFPLFWQSKCDQTFAITTLQNVSSFCFDDLIVISCTAKTGEMTKLQQNNVHVALKHIGFIIVPISGT